MTKTRGGVVWVEKSPTEVIKAGVCKESPVQVFSQVIEAVAIRSTESGWGSVLPFSLEGVKAAIDYLHYYEMPDLVVLAPMQQIPKEFRPALANDILEGDNPEWLNPETIGLPIYPTVWLPEDTLVVIPSEREVVGELIHITSDHVAAIVRDPSRTIAICKTL